MSPQFHAVFHGQNASSTEVHRILLEDLEEEDISPNPAPLGVIIIAREHGSSSQWFTFDYIKAISLALW